MSLLDDVSIVVTPNGYKAGELYAVIPVPSEGAELVTNGDFATDTDWVKGTGWTISGGSATSDGSGTSFLYQIISNVQTKRFLIEYEVKDYVSGSVSIILGSAGSDQLTSSSNGVVSGIVLWDGTSDRLNFKSVSLIGSIDNVSLKEYTSADMDVTRATAATRVDENGLVNYAQVISDTELVTDGDFPLPNVNWTLGGEAEITVEGARIYSSSGGQSYVKQSVLTNTKIYKLTYEIINSTQGSLKLINVNGLSDFPITSTVGTHTAYFTANNNEFFIYRNSGVTDVTIDNVSVKEVTRDNVPRIDYTGGGCPHILAEPQSTNLITYSEDISNSYWTNLGSSPASGFTSPSGTSGAFKLVEDTSSGLHWMYSGQMTVTNTTTYNVSVFAKKGERNSIRIAERSGVAVIVDLEDKVFDTIGSGVINSNITALVDDWVRIEYSFQTTSTSEEIYIYAADNGNINYQGNGSSGIYVWGVQLEQLSYPTSYIPTSGSTVTRNQDLFTRDGIGSLINSTEGCVFGEGNFAESNSSSYNYFVSLSDGTPNNRLEIRQSVSNLQFLWRVATYQSQISTSSLDVSGNFKFALNYSTANIKFYVNGNLIGTINTPTLWSANTLNRLAFDNGAGGDILSGKVRQLQVYDTALTDAQLTSLTT